MCLRANTSLSPIGNAAETPLTFDDGKGATARREGGGGDHRGRAHAPAYERPRGSM